MNAPASLHPTDQTLQAFCLGKLEDSAADAVGKHMDDCEDCRKRAGEVSGDSFLVRLQGAQGSQPMAAGSMATSRVANPASPASDAIPPELLNHPDYEIIRELGRGGMGVVYLAENKMMGRQEVLKVVGKHLVQRPSVLNRFLREIRSAAKLQHPNIVSAYAAMRLGESVVLAMEYVEGEDLSQLVKSRGPLPVANACYFIYQAALGLQHAHEKEMVHRDIKPANLILSRDGKKATVKVLDFGLAKVTSEGNVDYDLTHEGQMLGTPDYIAPEQTINAQKADIRADIYSLGCTFYYLLSGGPPFHGTSLYDLLQAHHSMDAIPLNLKRPEVPVELAALIGKMMAKEPERRFQSPAEVAQALIPFFKPALTKSSTSSAEMPQVKLKPVVVDPSPVAAPDTSENHVEGWKSLIDFGDSEIKTIRPVPLQAAVPEGPRSPWKQRLLMAAVGAGMVFFFGIIIYIATDKGRIKLEIQNPNQVVTIKSDGETIKLGGWKEPFTLKPGPHDLTVTWAGGESKTTSFVLHRGEDKEVRIDYEPKAAANDSENQNSPKVPMKDSDGTRGQARLGGGLVQGPNSSVPPASNGGTMGGTKGPTGLGGGVGGASDDKQQSNEENAGFVADAPEKAPGLGGFGPNQKGAEAKKNSGPGNQRLGSTNLAGFTPLFDGKKLKGFHVLRDHGRYEIVNGVLVLYGPNEDGDPLVLSSDRNNFRNFRLHTNVRKLDEVGGKQIAVRHAPTVNTRSTYAILLGEGSAIGDYHLGSVFRWSNLAYSARNRNDEKAEAKPIPAQVNEWHSVDVEVVKNRVTTWVDGIEACEYIDQGATLQKGEIALYCWKDKTCMLKEFSIQELDENGEPLDPPVAPKTISGGRDKPKKSDPPQTNAPGTNRNGIVSIFDGRQLVGIKEAPENKGTWGIEDGMLVLRGPGPAASGPAVLESTKDNYRNFLLRATILNTDGKSKQILVRRAKTPGTTNGYGVMVGGDMSGNNAVVPIGSINKATNRPINGFINWNVMAESVPAPIGDFHDLEILFIGNRIRTSVNGIQVAEYFDEENSYKAGAIGLVCRGDSYVKYKEILIQELDENGKPLVAKAENAVPKAKDKNSAKKVAKAPTEDALQPGTKWTGTHARIQEGKEETFDVTFNVFKRSGDSFQARFVTAHNDRTIRGTIANGEISWLAADVTANAGHPGHDHQGTIKGDLIELKYSGIAVTDGKPVSGTVSLRLVKGRAPIKKAAIAPAEDTLKPGSVWKGNRTYQTGVFGGVTVTYELHVSERNGQSFKGHVFDNGANRNRSEVEGEIQGNAIVWQERTSRDPNYTMIIEGILANDKIQFQLNGTYAQGRTNEGDGELVRQ